MLKKKIQKVNSKFEIKSFQHMTRFISIRFHNTNAIFEIALHRYCYFYLLNYNASKLQIENTMLHTKRRCCDAIMMYYKNIDI